MPNINPTPLFNSLVQSPTSLGIRDYLDRNDQMALASTCKSLQNRSKTDDQYFLGKAKTACESGQASDLPSAHSLDPKEIRHLDLTKILNNSENKYFLPIVGDYLRLGANFQLSITSLLEFPIGLTSEIIGKKYCSDFEYTTKLCKRLSGEASSDPRFCYHCYIGTENPDRKDTYSDVIEFMHTDLQQDQKFINACQRGSAQNQETGNHQEESTVTADGPIPIPRPRLRKFTTSTVNDYVIPNVPKRLNRETKEIT